MKLLLMFATLACLFRPSLTACTRNLCTFGILVQDGVNNILRFSDTRENATNLRKILVGSSFVGKSANDACAEAVCGANSTCQNITAEIFRCDCEKGFSATRSNVSFACTAFYCSGTPDEIINGTISPGCNNGSRLGTSCNITCIEGYRTTSTGVVVCDDNVTTIDTSQNGTWNNGGTICVRADECDDGTKNCNSNGNREQSASWSYFVIFSILLLNVDLTAALLS